MIKKKNKSLKNTKVKENKQKMYMFDFDGTIADTFPMFVDIAKQIADEQGLDKSAIDNIEKLKNLGTRKLMAKLGVSVYKMPSYAKRAQSIMNKRLDEIKIFPGIKKVLDELLDKGIRLCLLSSNSLENVIYVLAANDLKDHFEFIVGGSSLFGKDKKIKSAIKKYNLKDLEIYYFGDETRDVEGAKGAKVKSIAVTWGFNTREAFGKLKPDYILDEVEDILDL